MVFLATQAEISCIIQLRFPYFSRRGENVMFWNSKEGFLVSMPKILVIVPSRISMDKNHLVQRMSIRSCIYFDGLPGGIEC